jgi:hypothetical protein
MSLWVVVHEQAGYEYGQHKTKKAATAAAKEMQDAHEKVEALHDGKAVTFRVEKRADQEPVAEEAPVEEE